MFEHMKIQELNDFFIELNNRKNKGVYFYRISGFNEEIGQFILKYYEAARVMGVIIEGKIHNPEEKQLSYYNEIMGMDFQMSMGFITSSLKKWLPRMNDYQRNNVATSIYDNLEDMRKVGKNENMLKNAYIKFMCWLYYKFERIVNLLGDNKIPKILYEGEISHYELMLISILSNAGCDVVLLQYTGDQNYLSLDKNNTLSDNLSLPNQKDFPENFNLGFIRNEIQTAMNNERLYGKKPEVLNCTNAWIKGKYIEDIRTSIASRGSDSKLYYNCFYRVNGVEDKLTYQNDLYQFQLELKNDKRNVVIVDNEIAQPSMEEINAINRKTYTQQEQMLVDLSSNLKYSANIELQRIMIKSFLDIMLAESKLAGMNLNKLTNKAVYLICWIKRYQGMLFSNWKMPDISCFIYMGGCKNENEALFLSLLAKLPIDVLILNPNFSAKCFLTDNQLYELNFPNTLMVNRFPQESSDVHIGTAAYHAERELDTLIYQNSGMYRNQQYTKANTITLQSIYEEIFILWNEELKYRPNFSTVDDIVNIPVIFAKLSGVKESGVAQYWSDIKKLIVDDTFLIKTVPFIKPTDANPMKAFTADFFKNGKVQKSKIKSHQSYPYGFLREEIQNYMLDKLQLLIDQKTIKGTFENGTEYTIIATVLNLPKEIIRLIQQFDFTKKNPKLIYINTDESIISLEDSILTAFLNLVGFDILFFVPTGYQNVEKHYNKKLMEEHQIGAYMYDLQVPNLVSMSSNTRPTWRDKIFKRGT